MPWANRIRSGYLRSHVRQNDPLVFVYFLDKIKSFNFLNSNFFSKFFLIQDKLPENQSFETLLGHLETNLTNESLTLQTISRLDHQLADETEQATKILDKRIQHLIVKIFKVHSNSEQIQLAVFRLLDECLHIILKPSNKIDWNRDNVFESHFVEQLFYNFLVLLFSKQNKHWKCSLVLFYSFKKEIWSKRKNTIARIELYQ